MLNLRTNDQGEEYAELLDAIGTGVNLRLYRDRGIVSVVLHDPTRLHVLTTSAEIELDDLMEAVKWLSVAP